MMESMLLNQDILFMCFHVLLWYSASDNFLKGELQVVARRSLCSRWVVDTQIRESGNKK